MPSYAVDEAAQRLGISKTALRGRIRRRSVVAHKGVDGAWLVEVPEDVTQHTLGDTTQRTPTYDTSTPIPNSPRDALLDALMSEVDFLRAQLERETVAHAQEVHELHAIIADNRRALSATAQSTSQAHETAYEDELPVSASNIARDGAQRPERASRRVVNRVRRWWGRG